MPKRDLRKEAKTWAFDAHYDRFLRQHGDPVQYLFETAFNAQEDTALRLKAASELVRMRYPAKKAIEVQGQVDNTITLRDLRRPEKAIEGEVVPDWDD